MIYFRVDEFNDGKRSVKTMETYKRNLKVISRLFNQNEALLAVDAVINTLMRRYTSNHTIKNLIATICVYLKVSQKRTGLNIEEAMKKYIREIKVIDFDIKRKNASHKKTDKQEKNWITKEDWDELMNAYKINEEDFNNNRRLRDYIVLSIYKQVALRNNLVETIIMSEKEWKENTDEKIKRNNILVYNPETERCKLILRDYKTFKTYGEKIIDLNEDDILADLLELFQINENENKNKKSRYTFLLTKHDGYTMSVNGFCNYFKELGACINKELTTTLLRHCAVSQVYDLDKLNKLADRMGHSVFEAMTVYAKI